MSRRWLGRRPTVTAEQVATIQRRYALYLANRPSVIAAELGVRHSTVSRIGLGKGPKRLGGTGEP